MARSGRFRFRLTAALVVLAAAVMLVFRLGAGWPLARTLLNGTVLQPFGWEVEGGTVRWGLVPWVQIEATDLTVHGEGWRVTLGHGACEISGWDLLFGRLQIRDLDVRHLEVLGGGKNDDASRAGWPSAELIRRVLRRLEIGRLSWSDVILEPSGGPALAIESLRAHTERHSANPTLRIDALHALVTQDEPLALDLANLDIVATGEAIRICADEVAIGEECLHLEAELQPAGQVMQWRVRLQFVDFSLKGLQPLLDSTLTRSESRLRGRLTLWGGDPGLNFSGRVSGRVDPIDLDADTLQGYWDGHEIVLTEGRGRVRDMWVETEQAAIDPRTQNYRVSGRVRDVDPVRDLSFLTETQLRGEVRFTGSHFGGDEFWIDLYGKELAGTLWGLPLSGSALRFRYAKRKIEIDSLEVSWPAAQVRANGKVDLDARSMWWEGRLSVSKDSPFLAHFVPVDGLQGELQANARVAGPLSSPRLTATYSGTNLEYGALRLADYRGEADLDSVFTQPVGQVFLRGNGHLGTLPVRIDESRLTARGRSLMLRSFTAHQGIRRIQAAGPLWIENGIRGELSSLTMDSPFGAAEVSGGVSFRGADGHFALADTELRLARGSVSLSGSYDSRAGLDLDVVPHAVDLARLARLLGGDSKWVSGRLSGRASIAGEFANPEVRSQLEVSGARVGPVDLGRMTATLTLRDGGLRIAGAEARNEDAELHVSGVYPLGPQVGWWPSATTTDTMAFEMRAGGWDLEELGALVGIDSLAGRLGGSAEFSGRLTAPTVAAEVQANDLEVRGDRYGTVSLDGVIAGGGLQMDLRSASGSTARGVIPLEFCLAPPHLAPGPAPVDLQLELRDFDIGFVRHLVPDVTQARGRLDFSGELRGALPWPEAYGQARLEDGWVKLLWMDIPVHNIGGEAQVAGPWVDLHAHGQMGAEGRVQTDGKLRWEHFVPVDYNLEVDGRKVPVGWFPDLRAVVDARLKFTENLHISGKVDVREAVYSRDFGAAPQPIPPPPLPGEATPFRLSYDVEVHGDRHLWLRNTEAQMELRGDLRIQSFPDPADVELPFGIQGELEVIRGTYTILGKNRFTIERGSIQMLDPLILDPDVEIEASAVLRERVRSADGRRFESRPLPVHVAMHGKFFSDLSYEFTDRSQGDVPIPIEDVVLLLTFGRRRAAADAEGLYDPATAAADASAITAQLLESKVRKLLDISVEIGTGSVSPLESLDETYVGLGKYLNPRFFVYYSQYLSADPRRKLGVEYTLTDHVLLAGELDETDEIGPHYNVDLRYRLEY